MELNLPQYKVKLQRAAGGAVKIYDALRRRYLVLTPEEWVRQHFCHYLMEHLGYPAALIANEVSLQVGGVRRRCDSVVYHPQSTTPRIIIEYKAPHVRITQEVFHQIQSYNSVLRADYLFVSNGLEHYCCHIDYESQTINYLKSVPHYEEL